MFPKALEDPLSLFMMKREVIFGVNPHIVHINFKPFLCDHVRADVVHKCLKSGGCVAEAEEHDGWFK